MKYLAILCFIFISACKSTSTDKNIIIIKNKKLFVQIADTDQERARGLMHIKSLPQNKGMLFVFNNKSILSFWMKNTLIPLSIAYIDENCTIIDIQQMQPANKSDSNPPTYSSKKPAILALEVNINWFKANSIKVGDRITLNSKEYKSCSSKK